MAAPDTAPLSFPKRQPVTSLPLTIPASGADKVELVCRALSDRALADPLFPQKSWQPPALLKPSTTAKDCFEIDVNTLNLKDGTYEYAFMIDGKQDALIADPYAEEITKFGGYRALFTIRNGARVKTEFDWTDEIPQGVTLPQNEQMVIYEMPLHWMEVTDQTRQVGLGTFERTIYEHLQDLLDLGVNTIELLPIEDSADTLNWGYGTRFFFAPDWDMGEVLDTKFFVKCCHRHGIRVILDVVMNHSRECPLEKLAHDQYYLRDDEEPARMRWGGQAFRYANPIDGKFLAREFQYRMASHWVNEYHIDGFRIDEFNGINNWDFLQDFREHAWTAHNQAFAGRPFVVIGEDSARRAEATHTDAYRGRAVADALWNFDFRDELRRLLSNTMYTNWLEPSRTDRITNMISGHRLWDNWNRNYRPHGFSTLTQAINYVTSHDVEATSEQRLMNFFFMQLLRERGLATDENETDMVRRFVDNIGVQSAAVQNAHADALERVSSAFALMFTSAGMPMFLAGEEFADIHDLDHTNWQLKMSDPVDFTRRDLPGHRQLLQRVRELIALRSSHPALLKDAIEFFYWHPTIDNNNGVKVFAFCRTNGMPLGSPGQVVVLANCGPENFPVFDFPNFPWRDGKRLKETGIPSGAMMPALNVGLSTTLTASLAPFQVRVLTT
jgi:1,4-alpha-glucan branching enzyme